MATVGLGLMMVGTTLLLVRFSPTTYSYFFTIPSHTWYFFYISFGFGC